MGNSKNYIFSIIIIVVLIFVFSCKKPSNYPDTPQIDFYKLYIVDSIDTLGNPTKYQFINFRVIDGDGNVGVKQEDSTINLFIKLFKKTNGAYEEFVSEPPLNFRIPYTDPVGLDDFFKAEISVELFYTTIDYYKSLFDTIMYSFYIMDRDSNFSNIENTFDIPEDFVGYLIDTTAFVPTEL